MKQYIYFLALRRSIKLLSTKKRKKKSIFINISICQKNPKLQKIIFSENSFFSLWIIYFKHLNNTAVATIRRKEAFIFFICFFWPILAKNNTTAFCSCHCNRLSVARLRTAPAHGSLSITPKRIDLKQLQYPFQKIRHKVHIQFQTSNIKTENNLILFLNSSHNGKKWRYNDDSILPVFIPTECESALP